MQLDQKDQPRYDLIPPDALEEVAWVLALGGEKHGEHNWLRNPRWSLYLRPALGHIFAWAMRRGVDTESRHSHLAHAIACLLFLLAFELRAIGEDDRMPHA